MAHNFPVVKTLMSKKDIDRSLMLLAAQLHCDFPHDPALVLVGVKTRGVYLANRLAQILKEKHEQSVLQAELDITLYRDDLSTLASQPLVTGSVIDIDINKKKLVIVDDVLYTGRTVRAALDHLVDYGRPAVIRLAVVVDRGWREFPIQADYTGLKIDTEADQVIQVRLAETDEGHEDVLLCRLP